MFDYSLKDIFAFEKRDITHYLMNDLHLGSKLKDSFKYLSNSLGVQKLPKDLKLLKWSKGKNYDYVFVKRDSVTFGIRRYHSHYTIISKREKDNNDWARYAIFTFETISELLTDKESDERCVNWEIDLNKYINALFDLASEDKLHGLWNSYIFKAEPHVKARCVWAGGDDDIYNIDLFNFACEEFFGKFLLVFAETDMVERLKTVKRGDVLGDYTVISVNKTVKDEYYHAVGILWKSNREERFQDVYSLTRYYFSLMFPKYFTIK